ncbi:MAG: DUF3365 domain-containing protein [Thermodesulfobacteriota bacterium]
MGNPFSTKTYLALALGLLFATLSIVVVVLVNIGMKRLALTDAEQAARMLLDHNLAIHTYFSQDLKPKLFEQLGPITSKDYFEPVWMSSTYAIRKMDKYFRHFNPSPYYYKECAINARSPENEADDHERAFLLDLQRNPHLTTKSAIRVLDDKPYFTLLRRGETMEESCLRCHSSPEQAPGDLVRHYGPDRSFHRRVDEVAQAISVRIPLSGAFSSATRFSYYLSGLLLVVLGGGFLLIWIGNERLVIGPLAEIQEHAVLIASEHERLGETIPEPKVREVRDLVAAFNRMSIELRKTNDEQEQRIIERTKELAIERERLEVTLRSIGDGVISTDTKGRITALNRRAEELTGWTEAEARGNPLQEVFVIVNALTREACGNPVDKVLKTGESVGLANNTMLIAKDGKERILADSGAPIRAESGEILGVVIVFRDVTEKVRQEEALAKSEALLREAQRVAHIGHWELESLPGTSTWSEEIFHIFGLDPEKGEPSLGAYRDIIHLDDWELLERSVEALSSEGAPFDIEFRVIRPDGSIRWVNAKGYPQRNAQGEIIRLFGTAQDITERKKTEQERESLRSQLFQAQKMEAVVTLTGGIAHDFNNLLTIINGYTELILSEKTEEDPEYSDLQKIVQTGRKGAELVQKLLALSKKGEIEPHELNLNRVVEQAVAFMERTFPKAIEIETILEQDLDMINADASQIEQVLMNLCINAKEAMPEGGSITIETRNTLVDEEYCRLHTNAKAGPHVLIAIADTGTGMTKETAERVFDPFFTTKGWDFKKGTGLSLPVAKGIVEQHGGWITCESEPGKGTTFTVYLPAVHGPWVENRPKTEGHDAAGGKILLVDDEEYVLDLGKRILERAGYPVITASSGEEALKIYAREPSDIGLIVVDLMMPQMGGEKCIEQLLQINPRAKVIVSTGHSLDSAESLRLRLSARRFVKKPYEMGQLIQAVQDLL